MWKLWPMFTLFSLLLLCSSVAAQGSNRRRSKWQTLKGDAPLVIARGGFSGLFPDSSFYAYSLAVQTGLPDVHLWCEVQLTKDGFGICLSDIRLDNSSDIDVVYPNKRNTYSVNGVPTRGWFSVDFTYNDLLSVNLKQRIYSRAPNFDGTPMSILTVEDMVKQAQPPGLWLSIQHGEFFKQHNQSMRSFVISVSKRVIVNYVSSPEVGFLKSIVQRFKTSPTKLVFQFLEKDAVEPSTNQTYGSLSNNLTSIKNFATGILVPKSYIWPVDPSLYLLNSNTLVLDAHKAGLEVYASNFANDAILPYDYSYDPTTEYLSFIDNGNFSVDGVVSDFPITPSATIDCFSHLGKNDTKQVKLLVISSEGASGDFPGCTNKSYDKAVSDGVDILDCPVQITSDGIPFCLGSINLKDRTNVAVTEFINLSTSNPDLKTDDGIFAYSLTWTEIQGLKPAIFSPFSNYSLFRNPRSANDVMKLMQLSEFLDFANSAASVSGVLISIEHAGYLADKQGLDVTGVVLDALTKGGYNNQSSKRIMIASSDSAVLSNVKSSTKYELVYVVDKDVRDILNSTISEIKKFASSVIVSRSSVFPTDEAFLVGETKVVPNLQAFDLPVYVRYFRNEFVSQPWDFFSDASVQINTYVSYMGIDGVITDFPGTANRYRRNRCLGYKEVPIYMTSVQPGGLLSIMAQQFLPPAQAPKPELTESDVVEPPLPMVRRRPPVVNPDINSTVSSPTPKNGQPTLVASTVFSSIVILAALVLYSS